MTLLFLCLVGYVSIKVFKRLFPEEFGSSDKVRTPSVPGKNDTSTQQEPQTPWMEESFQATNPRPDRHSRYTIPRTLVFLAAISFLLFYNQDVIRTLATKAETESPIELANMEPSAPKVKGEVKVDGVYWYEITGRNSAGKSFKGWISEFSIKPEPAKKSVMIDSISKKLGLPTTEERVEYIKKLKYINSSLKTALGEK